MIDTILATSHNVEIKGVQALSEALKTMSTLNSLDLARNSIGDNGAQALSEALKANTILTSLDRRSNSIRDNRAQALAEALLTNYTWHCAK